MNTTMSQYNNESRAKLFNRCACVICHLSQTCSCTMNSVDNFCGLSQFLHNGLNAQTGSMCRSRRFQPSNTSQRSWPSQCLRCTPQQQVHKAWAGSQASSLTPSNSSLLRAPQALRRRRMRWRPRPPRRCRWCVRRGGLASPSGL